MKLPKPKKAPSVKPRRPFGLRTAFGSSDKAFTPPKSANAPDLAFTNAMAQPQQASLPMPTLPTSGQG